MSSRPPPHVSRRSALLGAAGLLAASQTTLSARAETSGTVKAVMHATLGVLDPYATSSYITRNHGYLVYDTLFALDAQNRPKPQMVDGWTVSDDRLTYDFSLRPGLTFHDGAPVTAADAVASLRRWMPRDVLGNRLAAVSDRVDTLDKAAFRLTLKRPYALVLETLAKPGGPVPFILPRRLVEIPESARITEVVGSGPFRFVAGEYRSGDRVVYQRFEGYVPRAEPASGLAGGKAARIDRVEWMEISDAQTGINALLAGEVQVMENIPPDMIPLLRRSPAITLKPRGVGNSLLLRLNSAQVPFNNHKVRQAVMAAVNQADYLAAQIGDPMLYRPCSSVLSCESPWASEVPGPGADPARARELLKSSGYADEKVILLHPSDLPSGSAIGPVTERLLQDIGMNVQMDTMDWNDLLARRARNVPVSQGGWSIAPQIVTDLDLMNPVVNFNLDARGAKGYVGWADDPEIERLREAFAFETDLAKQQAFATELQHRSNEQAYSIPLGNYKVVTGHRSTLTGVVADQVLVFWNMEAG